MKALFAILIVAALLLYGCTSASSQTQAGSKTEQGQPPKMPPNPPDASIGKGGILAENKTGQEKTNETIQAAIADGTYAKEVQYRYHSGMETVDFSVTVKDEVVTSVSVIAPHPVPMSARIIAGFSAALPDLVVGKKISEIKLPHNVAGSSLTSAAFQAYVDGIASGKEQAS